ncbi:MAG: DNA mismatch repair protein MutT [Ignavibacteriae bacterium HGW-Ignavibacteriae-3]|nr:MAG: DNA mismatch repair protein MutT [Ignavibacteriae bacterium HGW-Ignavibacteriae-3]
MQLATLCYLMDGERTLMLHRVKKKNDVHEGKWNGLGGKFEPGESPEECAIREVREECGLIIKKPVMHGFITFPMFDGKKDWYVFVFTAREFEGELIDSHEGKLEWIPDNKLLELNLWEGDRTFIPWLFEEKFFSAKFIYENGNLITHEVNFY